MTRTSTASRRFGFTIPAAALLALALLGLTSHALSLQEETAPAASLLRLMAIAASPESVDYVVNKTPFQLHTLLTEQRHPKTWTLGEKVRSDVEGGLRMLLSVDEDVAAKLNALAAAPRELDQLVVEIERALYERRKIYVYGCGATGRLAKQMESTFWRPFWKKIKAEPGLWAKLRGRLDPAVEEALIGEMTGADRALISSLEGFEDLPLIGRLQLRDRGIARGDLVIAVTEGGETSSVIGAILGALDQWKEAPGYNPARSRLRLYFVYNNPDDRLRPFERSRRVIEEPGITKINLATGPQAIAGSTRMQAATSETFVLGSALETAAERILRRSLSNKEMERLGFGKETSLAARLRAFAPLLADVRRGLPDLAKMTELEARTYSQRHFSTYMAKAGLVTVFIDSTERGPTFRLYPLDTVREPRRKCWIQVWTDAVDAKSAWLVFLGRPFRGLRTDFYKKPFEEQVGDAFLKEKALASLEKAGDGQALLYDFSFAGANLKRRTPGTGDLGVLALVDAEISALLNPNAPYRRFVQLVLAGGANLALILIHDGSRGAFSAPSFPFLKTDPKKQTVAVVSLSVNPAGDPFGVRAQVGLKMLLNAHSTAVMARLSKVVGNTMTNVSPSNLKLIGRATYLTMLHVNEALARPAWVKAYGSRRPIGYGEANAVLFESIAFMRNRPQDAGQAAEVPLSIIRILESLRRKQAVSAEEALSIYKKTDLSAYLAAAANPEIVSRLINSLS